MSKLLLWLTLALLGGLVTLDAPRADAAGRVAADPPELEAFLDRVVPEAMQQWHVPGAVMLVVQDDNVVLEKGYGFADLSKRIPMSPRNTVLRVYSLSKLLTATAIMQLVEQQRIDLDQDVNAYLRHVHIENPYSQPITIRHLLTHTAGFDSDQREIGGSVETSAEWLPLDRYLARRPPSVISPPGTQFVYTNVAYDLLGLVVEDVTGRPFAEYMSEWILDPLGMASSTFNQAPAGQSDVAVTYRYSMEQQTAVSDGLMLHVPAAGLTSTATDMAHFMLAELQDGRYGDSRILQSSTLREMHTQQFTYERQQPGYTLGFREAFSPRTNNGFREDSVSPGLVLWHTGGGPSAPTSYMQLRPDQGFGLFIAFNSDESRFLDQLLREFNDHYVPLPASSSRPLAADTATASQEDLSRFTGVYRLADYSRQTLSKVLLLEDEDLPQVVTSANSIGIRWLSDAPDEPEPLVHVAPLVFASRDGQFRFTFLADRSNAIGGMVWGNLFVLEKVPWYETVGFQRTLYGSFLVVFLIAAGAWPISAMVRRLRRRAYVGVPRNQVAALAAASVALNGAGNGLFLLGLLLVLPRAFDLGLQFGMPPALAVLFATPMLTTTLALALAVLAVLVLRADLWSRFVRLAFCVYSVVALAFVPFLLYWNLLGQRW